MKVRTRFPAIRGFVAAPAKAWSVEYELDAPAETPKPPFDRVGGYAVVSIDGPLEQRSGWLCDSYDAIKSRAMAAFASDAPAVALRVSSPGGDFAGSLELARDLRAMAKSSGKRLCAFTDSQCLSAAYALASAADEIVITSSAFVGSVGVWAALVDQTALDAMMGTKVLVVPSGERKIDHNPHAPISEGAVNALQTQVTAMARLFFDLVADHRGVGRASIEALEGAEFFGQKAVALGLADKVVNSFEEFTGVGAMAKNMKEARSSYRESLAKLAAEDSDEGKQARAALSEMDSADEKAAKKAEKDGGEEKKEAKGADEKDEPKAEDDKKKDESEAKAMASRALIEASRATAALKAQADTAEKTALLASRPDLDPNTRTWLAGESVESVKRAVATLPKTSRVFAPAAGATTMPTVQGRADGDYSLEPGGEESAMIARAMGAGVGVELPRVDLGSGDRVQATRYLRALDAAREIQASVKGDK